MNIRKFLFVTVGFLLFLFFQSIHVYGSTNNEVNLETIPDTHLFKTSNLKPGDILKQKLTIQNVGERDFIYNTEAYYKSGSKTLYDEYLLKVMDADSVLFEGKLKDFAGLDRRFLKSNHEEDLLFEAEFPYELGNEFQGLAFEFELKFYVEAYDPNTGETPEPDPEGKPKPDPGETPIPDPGGKPNPDPNEPPDPDIGNPDSGEPPDPDLGVDPDSDPSENPDPEEDVDPPPNPEDLGETPDSNDQILPERPIRGEGPPTANTGKILPSTASNMYNILFISVIVLTSGIILLIVRKKKIG